MRGHSISLLGSGLVEGDCPESENDVLRSGETAGPCEGEKVTPEAATGEFDKGKGFGDEGAKCVPIGDPTVGDSEANACRGQESRP